MDGVLTDSDTSEWLINKSDEERVVRFKSRNTRNLTPMQPPDYFIKYVLWNVNPPLTIPDVIPAVRFKGAEQCHSGQKWPLIFQSLADVNSSLAPIKRRGPPVRDTSRPLTRTDSLGRLIASVHLVPPVWISAPWSALGLCSSWPPAAAPTCGSLAQRTPHWRRARRTSWKPSRRKTWWELLETWVCAHMGKAKLKKYSNCLRRRRGRRGKVLFYDHFDLICWHSFSADWRAARSSGEAAEQRDALRKKARLAAVGTYANQNILHGLNKHCIFIGWRNALLNKFCCYSCKIIIIIMQEET